MDINEALRRVLKAAIVADGLTRGLREAAKALDKRQAHLCILATNCQEPLYIKLVEALCSEHNIPLLKVNISISSLKYSLSLVYLAKSDDKHAPSTDN
jgi:small subunit ribosomal protein S12e